MKEALDIQVKGVVQGVGFRPFIFKLALEHQLTGFVQNTPLGVLIEIQGSDQDIAQFNFDFSKNFLPLPEYLTIKNRKFPPKRVKNNSKLSFPSKAAMKDTACL